MSYYYSILDISSELVAIPAGRHGIMGNMNTVVITGVSRGLGRVIAEMCVEKGWRVIGTGRSERPSDFPDAISYYQFDASDAAACLEFWKEVAQDEQSIHLINNAGGYLEGRIADVPASDFHDQMASNYFASVHMTQALMTRVPRARMVNILSSGALGVHAGQAAYGASKAAAMHFFQTLQAEVSSEDYQITNIYPTNIATHGPSQHAMSPADLARLVIEQIERQDSFYIRDMTVYAR